jgi:hypothetical protein
MKNKPMVLGLLKVWGALPKGLGRGQSKFKLKRGRDRLGRIDISRFLPLLAYVLGVVW